MSFFLPRLQFLTLMAAVTALFLIACVSQALVSGNRALNIFSSNPNGHERPGSRAEQACKTGGLIRCGLFSAQSLQHQAEHCNLGIKCPLPGSKPTTLLGWCVLVCDPTACPHTTRSSHYRCWPLLSALIQWGEGDSELTWTRRAYFPDPLASCVNKCWMWYEADPVFLSVFCQPSH